MTEATVCPCGAERPCMSPMTRCDHPMRRNVRATFDQRLQVAVDRLEAAAAAAEHDDLCEAPHGVLHLCDCDVRAAIPKEESA